MISIRLILCVPVLLASFGTLCASTGACTAFETVDAGSFTLPLGTSGLQAWRGAAHKAKPVAKTETFPRLCSDPAEPERKADRDSARKLDIYAQDNLVAWCIVPFDAAKRGPGARAQMLSRLQIKHVAYDWRKEHIATFEEEIIQYKKHGLNYFAFWSWHDSMESLIRKHDIHPQIWVMMKNSKAATQQERVSEAVDELLPLVAITKSLNCKLAIYNHGGWAGIPENMVEVAKTLRRKHSADHVGIVYNFHHSHDRRELFKSDLKLMMPYLHCVNINGMDDAAIVSAGKNKILPIGSGKHELTMMKTLQSSGYRGRIGILDHRNELDSAKSLQQNLTGLASIRKQLTE